MSYNLILKELETSRRLNTQMTLERQLQQLERNKIDKQLQILRRSRKNYIDGQVAQSKLEYQEKLKEDPQVSEEHLNRQKKVAAERAKFAQSDFERERERLFQERSNYENLENEHGEIKKKFTDLQIRSKLNSEEEDRKLVLLKTKKQTIIKLLEESKRREVYHMNQSKQLSVA